MINLTGKFICNSLNIELDTRLSEAVKDHLGRLEKSYCIVYPLYDKFNR